MILFKQINTGLSTSAIISAIIYSSPLPRWGEGWGGGILRNAIAMSGAAKMFVLKYNSLDNTKWCGNLSISDNISHIRGRS